MDVKMTSERSRAFKSFLARETANILSENKVLSLTVREFGVLAHATGETVANQLDHAYLSILVDNLKQLRLSGDAACTRDIQLNKFAKMQFLELSKIDVRKVAFETISDRLEELSCVCCTHSDMRDMFSSSSGACWWTQLRTFSFKCSVLRDLHDDFLSKIRFIECLDLSGNRIDKFCTKINLPCLKYLNLSYNKLRSVPLFGQNGSNRLQTLILKGNVLRDLKMLHFYYYLWELDISMNAISDVSALKELSVLRALQRLHVRGNAICALRNYRKTVLSFLSKNVYEFAFILDNEFLSKSDAKCLGAREFAFDFQTGNPNEVLLTRTQALRNEPGASLSQPKNRRPSAISYDSDDDDNDNDDDIEILQASVIDMECPREQSDVDADCDFDLVHQAGRATTLSEADLFSFEAELLNNKSFCSPQTSQQAVSGSLPGEFPLQNSCERGLEETVAPCMGDVPKRASEAEQPEQPEPIRKEVSGETCFHEEKGPESRTSDTQHEPANESSVIDVPEKNVFATINHHLRIYFFFTLFESRDEDLVWYLSGVIAYDQRSWTSAPGPPSKGASGSRDDVLFNGLLVLSTRKLYVLRIDDRDFDINDLTYYQNNDISRVIRKVGSATVDRLQGIGCMPWKQGIFVEIRRRPPQSHPAQNQIYCLCITEDFYVTNDFVSYLFYKKCLPENCKIIFETNGPIRSHLSSFLETIGLTNQELRLLSTISEFSMKSDAEDYRVVTLFITSQDLIVVLDFNEMIVQKGQENADCRVLARQPIRLISDKTVDTTNRNFVILIFSDFTEWRFTVKNSKSLDWILSNLQESGSDEGCANNSAHASPGKV